MKNFEVRITISVPDVESESPATAIKWVKDQINSVLDFGMGAPSYFAEEAIDYTEE